jgi:glutamate synthase domain-containing protein 2/glutamate synthase domain-containing protein 1/glutamate synthase domain-containing protein 3
MHGLPSRQGLYDPAHEHDSCGLGFVAHTRGVRSHSILRQSLQLLDNLSHRGAAGCDPCTGDGAGISLQLPHALFARDAAEAEINLPAEGSYGVGMCFLPRGIATQRLCERVVAEIASDEGHAVLGWRVVPCDESVLGERARPEAPAVRQLFISAGDLTEDAFERKLFVIRRRIESAMRSVDGFYIASCSSRTVVYKGMLTPEQLPRFYGDLADEAFVSAIALVHSRFSTNTFPTWSRAHPYRLLCHNGEINTLRGNANWMRVREGTLTSRVFGADLEKLYPIIGEDQSDSATLDNVLEFLMHGGRSLPQALMMLIPEAWEGDTLMDADRRAFYEFHASMMEPWDGPAAVAFTDGRVVGATLDRNGLRPGRWAITSDDLVVLSSEAGALELPAARVTSKGRLQPGKMFLVDTVAGRVLHDDELKRETASAQPYAARVASHRIDLDALPALPEPGAPRPESMLEQQAAFAYTTEELRMVLAPMATTGEEPIGSMGTDTPLAVLSEEPRLLFDYFTQQFAQVTNPPIDPIREQLVMSLGMNIGPRSNLLDDDAPGASRVRVRGPVLNAAQRAKIDALTPDQMHTRTLSMLFPVAGGSAALESALEALCEDCAHAVREGCTLLVLSDRGVDDAHAPIPSLLATAAVHSHLIAQRLRTETGLIVETGEARDVSHFALLLGFGAGTIHPYLALDSVAALARDGMLGVAITEQGAQAKYVAAVEKGLLKIFSKMGISTAQSYCGAQLFESIGLGPSLIDRYFSGTKSRLGGIGIEAVAQEALARHAAAFAMSESERALLPGGQYVYRAQGEHHAWNPDTISTLQHAAWTNSGHRYDDFARIANDERTHRATIRGLLDFAPATPIDIEEVEPAAEIVRRFVTGAMSFGSLSREAHETLALAMNALGGRSNSGEGGEAPERYGSDRNSAIKQIASARFGVTAAYLVSARELQIKMAQGAKPGEGGQLPGNKVDAAIARVRHSTPGVTLISPPPHHDIYSIEDLAQLIFDLRHVNPSAVVSVKLVAETGVGTIAAGVAKAGADLILISGDSGGTGSSPLSSIKHAGIPWELGLAETHQTLVLNDLRGRVRLQTDGQLKTGRDVVIAALLGAEEFGFSTAPLIAEGCVMMRKCHLNTCPVGIATQDPVLRAKFSGKPEYVINYFFFVAEEARALMARLGFRTTDEMIGRTDALCAADVSDHWKARTLDMSALLWRPETNAHVATRCESGQPRDLERVLDHALIAAARPALDYREPVHATFAVRNVDRSVGAMLSGEIARRFGDEGLPDGTLELSFAGSAGQSFGAFCAKGVTLSLEGEANDYVGKGLSGGRLVVHPPYDAAFDTSTAILLGNVALYGATSGEAYFAGPAGERFAVRNSGATAVVEGVGDHGCEYMTGGTVVVLGPTGRNFAAGMSGGIAFVLDPEQRLERRCNRTLVELGPVTEAEDIALLRDAIVRHARYAGSALAMHVLRTWAETLPQFVRVMPIEYKAIRAQQYPHAPSTGSQESHGRSERIPVLSAS